MKAADGQQCRLLRTEGALGRELGVCIHPEDKGANEAFMGKFTDAFHDLSDHIILPGLPLPTNPGGLRGHGTYEREDTGVICASVVGTVEVVNKLTYVKPLNQKRYEPTVGDIVIGRIVEVGAGRWTVDIGACQRAQLPLASALLLTSEQRIRTEEDELQMRELYTENDLICTEVQRLQLDGVPLLQTRNTRYGRLVNGCSVKVDPVLIPRQRDHMIVLPNKVYVVLGCNGTIWIGIPPKSASLDLLHGAETRADYECVQTKLRKEIAAVRNTILLLAECRAEITPEAIAFVYQRAVTHRISTQRLINFRISRELVTEYLEAMLNPQAATQGEVAQL